MKEMTQDEVLELARAFDPTQLARGLTPQEWAEVYTRAASKVVMEPPKASNREGIMRLALEMIVAQCDSYEAGGYDLVTRIQRTAEQALKECSVQVVENTV